MAVVVLTVLLSTVLHGVTHLKAELSSAPGHGARKLMARALELRGRALLILDDREAAEVDLREALRKAQSIGYPPVCWRALALLGEVACRAGSASGAEQSLEAAAGVIEGCVGSLRDAELSGRLRALGPISPRIRSLPAADTRSACQ